MKACIKVLIIYPAFSVSCDLLMAVWLTEGGTQLNLYQFLADLNLGVRLLALFLLS